MLSSERIQVRYSEAFKLQVIQELESGKHDSLEAARRAYDIHGTRTIRGWLLKYGRNDLLGKVIRVEKPNEVSELKRLREEVAQLKAALADTQVECLISKACYEVACEEHGIDPEEFKKKHAIKSLKRPLKRRRHPLKKK